MKNLLKIFPIIIYLTLAACEEAEVDELSGPVSNTQAEVQNTLKKGEWTITEFWNENMDYATDYKDYLFTFNENNQLNVVKGDTVINGSWSAGAENGILQLEIQFENPEKWILISKNWYIGGRSDVTMRLEEIYRGGVGTTRLTLKKIGGG